MYVYPNDTTLTDGAGAVRASCGCEGGWVADLTVSTLLVGFHKLLRRVRGHGGGLDAPY